MLRHLNQQGTTIFLTTHNMEEADKLCSRIGILNQGKLIAGGSPRELKLEYARDEIEVLTTDRETLKYPKNRKVGSGSVNCWSRDAVLPYIPRSRIWRKYFYC